MARIGYTPGDVAELLDVPTRNVRLLIEQGVLIPSVPARGRGRPSLFDHPDLVEAGVAFRLREAGIAPKSLVAYVAAYRKAGGRRTSGSGEASSLTSGLTEHLLFGMREEDIDTLEAWVVEDAAESDESQGTLHVRADLVVTVSVNITRLRADLESRLLRMDDV